MNIFYFYTVDDLLKPVCIFYIHICFSEKDKILINFSSVSLFNFSFITYHSLLIYYVYHKITIKSTHYGNSW